MPGVKRTAVHDWPLFISLFLIVFLLMLDDSYCCLNVDKLQNTVDVNFGYNYAEAQKRTIISECNLGYTTVTQNAKLLILFNAETHVQFNFGDTISDLDVAFRTRSSFSNSYCCVETVN